jgi:methionyl-tRNA formyltransferase
VIVEHPSPKPKKNIVEASISIVGKARSDLRQEQYNRINDRYFGDKWHKINDKIPVMDVDNINTEIVLERLKKENPDLLVDHGTSLVKDYIIDTSPLALNIHWGLSPYYRGTYCTEWALVNWDPYNIGVTIHKLSKIIDGGEILRQARAEIKPGDTAYSINMHIAKLGTELMIKVIDEIKSGKKLEFHKQDPSRGFVTLTMHRSKYIRKQVKYIENNNLIEIMLKKPARKQKLPIIE